MSDLLTRLETRQMPTEDLLLCLDLNLLNARADAIHARDTALNALAAEKAKAASRDTLVSSSVPAKAAQARLDEAVAGVDAVEAQIAASSIRLRIRGVDRVRYNAEMLKATPRKGRDETFNPVTFYLNVAKVASGYVDAEGIEHPITVEEWQAIDAALTDGEYGRLAAAVVKVNRESGSVDVAPFAIGSETIPRSSATSGSRAPSGSRRAASTAGSRAKSTSKTSTSKAAVSSE